MGAAPRVARRHLLLVSSGLVGLATCVVLYTSGVSRAVAVWLLPLGAATTVVGWAGAAGRRVPRWAYVVLAAVAGTLALLAAATWVYSLVHQPTPV